MALTQAQKQEVVMFLGWPAKTLLTGSTNYASVVDDRLKNLTPEIEAQVEGYLNGLRTIDSKLSGAWCRLSAKRVDEIELNPDEIRMLRSERRRLVRLLGQLLDIAVLDNGAGINVSICV